MLRRFAIGAGVLLAFLGVLVLDANTSVLDWLGGIVKVLIVIGILLFLIPWILLLVVVMPVLCAAALIGNTAVAMRQALKDGLSGEFGRAYWKGFFTALLLAAISV